MSVSRDTFFKNVYVNTRGLNVGEADAYFEREKMKIPALHNETLQAFAQYWLHRNATERQQERTANPPSAEQLWAAVRAWKPDPLSTSPDAHPTAILDYLGSKRFAPVPLGKFRGEYMCRLEPMVALAPDDDRYNPNLPFSLSNRRAVRAIKYADGHPSEEHFHRKNTAGEDKILRRFISIGFVHMMIEGKWVKTGHALVLDASHGRNCHPWFVLAQEWHTTDEKTIMTYDTEYLRPPQRVRFNDEDALGVLPGSSNRTPIAPLIHWNRKDEPDTSEKFFEDFGENFSFDLGRMGHRKEEFSRTP